MQSNQPEEIGQEKVAELADGRLSHDSQLIQSRASFGGRRWLIAGLFSFTIAIGTYGWLHAQETQAKVKPTIDDFAWIAGHWQGEAMGGKFEETWNPPFGGTMMGMFKMVDDDGVSFYELLTIVEKGDSFVLRLKHFDKSLVGWEEKDKSVEFPLVSVDKKAAIFKGLRFEKMDQNKMQILVVVGQGEGKEPKEIKFACQRAGK